ALYAQPIDAKAMRAGKRAAIAAFRQRYAAWRAGEGSDRPGYDAWVAAPIDNAKLVPFGLYDHWLPVFEQLFVEAGQDWQAFHQRVETLAETAHGKRQRLLEERLLRAQQGAAVR